MGRSLRGTVFASLFPYQPTTTAVDKQILPDALNRCVAAGERCITGGLAEEHVRHMVNCICPD